MSKNRTWLGWSTGPTADQRHLYDDEGYSACDTWFLPTFDNEQFDAVDCKKQSSDCRECRRKYGLH